MVIKPYSPLETLSLPKAMHIAHPPSLPELIHLEDPIFDVFVDFHFHSPATIQAKQSMDDALFEMKASGAHMLLVLNENGHMVGLLSSQALHGERPYKIIQEGREKHSEITVASIMLPMEQVLCLDHAAIKSSKIGHLVETFKRHHRHYAVVIQQDHEGKEGVSGYFSASRISRTLSLNTAAAQELKSLLRDFE